MDCSTPASLSITNSWSLLKLMSIELVMPSNLLIFCCPLLLLPSIFPSIRVFSNELVLHIRWPNWSFSFSISPSKEYSRLISLRIDWFFAEFQRIARRDKKAFLRDQCKEIEENKRMGKTRDLFKKTGDTKGIFHAKMGTIKDRKFWILFIYLAAPALHWSMQNL